MLYDGGMRHAWSAAVAGAMLLASLPAAADVTPETAPPVDGQAALPPPKPPEPATPPPATPPPATPEPAVPPPVVGPRAVPPPPFMMRRSQVAMSSGIAAVALGGIAFVGTAVSAGIQLGCGCRRLPTVIGLAATGGVLLALGIPLILYGAKMVPVVEPVPTVAIVPRKQPPAWMGAPGSEGWAFRF